MPKAPTRKQFDLDFSPDADGTEHVLAGLTVTCRSTSRRVFDELTDLGIDDQIDRFLTEYVVEWDLQDPDTGTLVPRTPEGVADLEPWIPLAMLRAWGSGLYTIPAPLGKSSNGGTD
jgi:hypothetical protein